jgi:hypothetical protein
MDYPGEIITKEQADARLEEILPRAEEYIDCAGVKRVFTVYRYRPILRLGYLFCAQEQGVPDDQGYLFDVFTDGCPFQGLVRLTQKIKAGLATKYLEEDSQGTLKMRAGTITGRLVSGGVNVDGRHICWDDFEEMLAKSNDGSQFELRLSEVTD